MTAHHAEQDGQQSTGDDRLRAADDDRQWVAERLRAALDQGRLRLAEYDERLRLAYQAQTYAELNLLLDDLPPAIVGGTVAVAQPHQQPAVPTGVPAVQQPAATGGGRPTRLVLPGSIRGRRGGVDRA